MGCLRPVDANDRLKVSAVLLLLNLIPQLAQETSDSQAD